MISGVLALASISLIQNPGAVAAWAAMGLSPMAGVLLTLVPGLLNALAGYGILKARAWSRPLYLGVGAISLLVNALLSTPVSALLFSAAIYLPIAIILTRRSASDYFSGKTGPTADDMERRRKLRALRVSQRRKSDLSQIFGVGFAVGGGFLLSMALLFLGFGPIGEVAIISAFVGTPGAIAIGVGILLWGRRRWAAVGGWTLAAVGAWTVITGAGILAMLDSEIWVAAQASTGQTFDSGALALMTATGVVCGLLGAGLLYIQHASDNEAVAALVPRDTVLVSRHA